MELEQSMSMVGYRYPFLPLLLPLALFPGFYSPVSQTAATTEPRCTCPHFSHHTETGCGWLGACTSAVALAQLMRSSSVKSGFMLGGLLQDPVWSSLYLERIPGVEAWGATAAYVVLCFGPLCLKRCQRQLLLSLPLPLSKHYIPWVCICA